MAPPERLELAQKPVKGEVGEASFDELPRRFDDTETVELIWLISVEITTS